MKVKKYQINKQPAVLEIRGDYGYIKKLIKHLHKEHPTTKRRTRIRPTDIKWFDIPSMF